MRRASSTPDMTSTLMPVSFLTLRVNFPRFSASLTALVATALIGERTASAMSLKRRRVLIARLMALPERCFMSVEPLPSRTISLSLSRTLKRPVDGLNSTTRRCIEFVPMSIAARVLGRLFTFENCADPLLQDSVRLLEADRRVDNGEIKPLRDSVEFLEDAFLIGDETVVEIPAQFQVHTRLPVIHPLPGLILPVPFCKGLAIDDPGNQVFDIDFHIENRVGLQRKTEHAVDPLPVGSPHHRTREGR